MSSPGTTVFGVIALTFMMVMYALERRHANSVVAFAIRCFFKRLWLPVRRVALRRCGIGVEDAPTLPGRPRNDLDGEALQKRDRFPAA